MKLLSISTLLVLTAACFARPVDDETFTKLKGLAGTWSGVATLGKDKMPVTVKYRVVSNGSAVEETIAPNTPHEMVTMYYMDGQKLALTHYCALGNQPHMSVTGSGGDQVKFGFDGGTNCHAGGTCMTGVSFKFLAADHIGETWIMSSKGKEIEHIAFDITRQTAK